MEKQEKKIKYEKPELIDLASQLSVMRARGTGNCNTGASANHCGTNGGSATIDCTAVGQTAIGAGGCSATGSHATAMCTVGTSPT